MSMQTEMWPEGGGRSDNGTATSPLRAGLFREMAYLLTISTDTHRRGKVSQVGVAHSLGVCLIEDYNMARGRGSGKQNAVMPGMPRFVDVRLTADDRELFGNERLDAAGCVRFLQSMADEGYRVGVTWSGEHQCYTVSLTCRAPDDVNNGMCMTSFAGDLFTAVSLARFKHVSVTGGMWAEHSSGGGEAFG